MNRLVAAGIGLFFGGAAPPATAPAAPPTISLFVSDDSNTRLPAAPVWMGAPLAEGLVKDPDDVRLTTADGKPVPVQASVLTRRPDGSIRALMLDFQTNLAGARKQTFRLHRGGSAPRPAFASPVRVAETADAIRVATGPLSFAVAKKEASFLEDVRWDLNGDGQLTDDEQVVAGGADLLASTSAGVLHRSSLDTESWRALIEEQGPARAAIKCSGWHVSADGSRFCQHILRIHAFAGKSYLRLQHTFVFTADPEAAQLKSLGIVLPLKAAAVQVRCALEAGEPARCASPAVWLQDRRDHFAVREGTKVLVEGKTSPGSMTLSGERFAATAIVREAWRNFPKALEAGGTGLTIWLWPPHVPPLDMKRYSQTTAGEDACAVESAMGLAKTHEVFLDFHKPDADVSSLVKWVQRRPVALPQPAAMCASGVLGDLCPEDPRRFPQPEVALRGCMDWLIALQERFAWWGMIDYGDIARIYNKKTRSWLGSWAEGQGGWEGHNGWMNNEFGYARTPWIMTVRTGDPNYFRFAEAHARHIMDVDTAHYDPKYPWRVGGQHRHGPQHWCDGVGASHTYAIYLPAYYQLTGDRRALDVIQEMSQYYLLNVRPCTLPGEPETIYHLTTENGMQPGRPNPPETSYTNLRPVGAGITGLVKLYEVTNDKRLLKRAAEQIRLLCRSQRADGTWDGEPQFDKNNVLRWSRETPWAYASRLADAFSSYCQTAPHDAPAKEAFAKWARACILQGPEHPFGDGLLCAGAYRATGDERFLAYGEAWLLSHAGRPGPDQELGFPQATEGLFDPLRSIPPILKPLAEWRAGRERRQELLADIASAALALPEQGPVELRLRFPRTKRFVFLDADDADFHITLFRTPYGTPRQEFPPVINMTLSAPDDAIVKTLEVSDDRRIEPGPDGRKINLVVPRDGKKGVYRLTISDRMANWWHVETSLPGMMANVAEGKEGPFSTAMQRSTMQLYFYVPAGTKRVTAEVRADSAGRGGAALFAPSGRAVDQKASRAAGTPEQKSPPAGWHYMTATPPPDETGRVWRLGVYARGSFALKLVGVPEYVALREGDVFRMDSAELLAPRADLPVRH